jgi:hypothetical protein
MCATTGKDGWAAAVELRSGKTKGQGSGRMHIHSARGISDNGALVATMVCVPPSLGQMPARGIMEHLLAMMVSLLGSPLSVGQATVIFFYIGF